MKAKFISVYITCADKAEAVRIGRALVRVRLAACVNVLGPVRSVYRWKGKVRGSSEVAMLAKTTSAKFSALKRRVLQMHSYECPCVVAFPIERGNDDFLKWVASEVAP